MTFPTSVDSALKATIYDWFQFREVNDDEKFPVMFRRTLNASMRKYLQLIQIEPGQQVKFPDNVTREVTYDWLVQNYKEMTNYSDGTTSKSDYTQAYSTEGLSASSTGETTTHMVGTDDTDRDRSSSNSTSRNLADSSNISTTNSTNGGSDTKGMAKTSPQSVSYAGVSGVPNTLDWQYPSGQNETVETHNESGTSGQTDVQSHTGSTSGTAQDNESVDFATERTTVQDTAKNDYTSKNTSNDTATNGTSANHVSTYEIANGRSLAPAEILKVAKEFILSSSAWEYLYGQLDKNFQGIMLEW